jgi:hypothetical protein
MQHNSKWSEQVGTAQKQCHATSTAQGKEQQWELALHARVVDGGDVLQAGRLRAGNVHSTDGPHDYSIRCVEGVEGAVAVAGHGRG